MRQHTQRQRNLDEVSVKINGVQHYLWRLADLDDEVLEKHVTKTRDKPAAVRQHNKKTLGNLVAHKKKVRKPYSLNLLYYFSPFLSATQELSAERICPSAFLIKLRE